MVIQNKTYLVTMTEDASREDAQRVEWFLASYAEKYKYIHVDKIFIVKTGLVYNIKALPNVADVVETKDYELP